MGAGWQRWWRDKPDNPARSVITTVPGSTDDGPRFEPPPPIDDALMLTFRSWMYWCETCQCYDHWPHHVHGVFRVES